MRNSDILLKRLRRKPEDKTLALVTADALMEELDLTRRDALKEVARCRLPVLRAKHVTEAVRLLRTHSPRRRLLANWMLNMLCFESNLECTVYTVAGFREPSVGVPPDNAVELDAAGPSITVGARWLLRLNRMLRVVKRAQRDKARGITRFK